MVKLRTLDKADTMLTLSSAIMSEAVYHLHIRKVTKCRLVFFNK